ncbi:MAG TPA: aspartate aminotransferase family protein [Candidatus Saccharimonadales bacterium]|nr:aspartate aminotransferase family protein [Candidatus Saccharimonadales bacterium]
MTTKQVLDVLRAHESRNIVFVEPDGSWPIVWTRAKDVQVWGADGKKYLDLTAAFGVAAAGHANPRVVKAGQRQLARLPHAMGDVHPHPRKAELARELSRITFERWTSESKVQSSKSKTEMQSGLKLKTQNSNLKTGKAIFSNSGFEAVESALKTAALATGRRGIIAFEGAYHGLGYGALNVTHRDFFRGPFRPQLHEFGHFVPFPKCEGCDCLEVESLGIRICCQLAELERKIVTFFKKRKIGAILIEPIQARAGINLPPFGFLPMLRKLCDEHGALLILDEIYTGFGRTGKWFACEHSGVVPDLICLGKALTGGFPLSACVGRADIMDAAWPESRGEAIHTSTFLGNPVGCAMAMAQIEEIWRLDLCQRSKELGRFLLDELSQIQNSKFKVQARGLGLMAGVELRVPNGKPATAATMNVIKKMLHRGFILLPEGEHANVISFTPPLTITKAQLQRTVKALAEVLATDWHR